MMNWKRVLTVSILASSLVGGTNLEAATASVTVGKDKTAPVVPSVAVNKYINQSNDGKFFIKGRGEAGSRAIVSFLQGKTTITVSSKVDARGKFTINANTKKFTEGPVIFTVVGVDKAGNKSKKTTLNLVKDVTVEELSIDNEGYINSFNQGEYPVTGIADIGSKIEVSLESGKSVLRGSGKADEDGNFAIDVDATSLAEGNVKVVVKQIDKAGNSQSQTVEVLKETKAPNAPMLLSAGEITAQTSVSYVISGVGVKNGEVEITLTDGLNEVSSMGTADETGRFDIEVNTVALENGEITITAKQTSESGNESPITTTKTTKK